MRRSSKEIDPQTKKYHPAGYHFLNEALLFTRLRLQQTGHVTGRELLDGFRELALERYGPLSRVVLEHWGISCTEDVGDMVRILVERGVWSRRAEDSWDDFKGGFGFREAFEEEFPWRVQSVLGLEEPSDEE